MVDKFPSISLNNFIKSNFEKKVEGYKHQSTFYYPLKGGIQAYISALEKKCKNISTGCNVDKVYKKDDKWFVDIGGKIHVFDKLVSTIPLPELSKVMQLPVNVKKAINNLLYNNVNLILLGVKKKRKNPSWVYFPQETIPFHRAVFLNKCSPNLAPNGCCGIILEITVPPSSKGMYRNTVIKHCIRALRRSTIFSDCRIITNKFVSMPYAYIIYDTNHKNNMSIIREYFDKEDLVLAGRNGEFEYMNMDQCTERALEVAQQLKR